jgi:AraC-like DNA-binding protein
MYESPSMTTSWSVVWPVAHSVDPELDPELLVEPELPPEASPDATELLEPLEPPESSPEGVPPASSLDAPELLAPSGAPLEDPLAEYAPLLPEPPPLPPCGPGAPGSPGCGIPLGSLEPSAQAPIMTTTEAMDTNRMFARTIRAAAFATTTRPAIVGSIPAKVAPAPPSGSDAGANLCRRCAARLCAASGVASCLPGVTLSAPIDPGDATGEHTVPAGVLLPLVDAVKHWGVDASDLLGPFSLSEGDLAQPLTRFPLAVYLALADRARTLTGEPGIGIGWGLQMRIATFGALGFATMTSATLGDALALANQMAPLGCTAEGLRLVVEGGSASIVLEEHADFGVARDVIVMARLTGLWRIAEAITGRHLDATAEVPFPEPPYFRRFASHLPRVRFEQPTTRALIPAEALSYPLVMSNALGLRLANDQCVRELETLGARGRLAQSVRAHLFDETGRLRASPRVARAMGVSERTLRRRLSGEGLSLLALVEEQRRDRALLLLRDGALSLEEVAGRLGYASAQSFERAFRRWTGVTPGAYRRRWKPRPARR